jgi:hypothetical protein
MAAQNQTIALIINALTEAYTALQPNVTFDIEVSAAGGTEIDNLLKPSCYGMR